MQSVGFGGPPPPPTALLTSAHPEERRQGEAWLFALMKSVFEADKSDSSIAAVMSVKQRVEQVLSEAGHTLQQWVEERCGIWCLWNLGCCCCCWVLTGFLPQLLALFSTFLHLF
jgi:hypothetical protein